MLLCTKAGCRCLYESGFFSCHLKKLCLPLSRVELELSALQCCTWCCWGMFGDWVLPNSADREVWRLSVRESSLSLYGPTLRPVLPGGDSAHSYWHFDPMHNPEILVHIAYLSLHWIFSTEHFWFLRSTAFPVNVHQFTATVWCRWNCVNNTAKMLILLRYHNHCIKLSCIWGKMSAG